MTKRTYQPKTKRRARKHGFFARIKDKCAGVKVLKRRRIKKRAVLSKTTNQRYK